MSEGKSHQNIAMTDSESLIDELRRKLERQVRILSFLMPLVIPRSREQEIFWKLWSGSHVLGVVPNSWKIQPYQS